MIPSFISQFWSSPSPLNSIHDNEDSPSRLNSIGRSIKQIGSCAVTVAKVVGIFGLFIGLSLFPIVPVLGGAILHNPSHYIAPAGVGGMAYEPPTFPAYTAWFMHPGLQLARSGTTACDITPCLERKSTCDRVTTNAVTNLEGNKAFDEIDQKQTFRQKGIIVPNNTINNVGGRTLHFRINGRKFENYEKALHYVEQTILVHPETHLTRPEALIKTIKRLHSILMQDLPDGDILTPGSLRTLEKAITPAISLDDVKIIAKNCLTEKEFEIFELSQKAFIASNSRRIFTPEERKIWNKCFFLPISPLEIQPRLDALAKKLSVHIERNFGSSRQIPLDSESQKLASIKIAGYVHMKLIEIHPVLKGNGHIARLFMNSILRCYGGFDPVIFDSEKGYMDAVKAGLITTKNFTNYLKDHAIPWTKKQSEPLSQTAEYMTLYKTMNSHDYTFTLDSAVQDVKAMQSRVNAELPPINEARYLLTGVQLVLEGTAGCKLESPPQSPEECQNTVQMLNCSSLSQYNTADAFMEKGTVLTLQADGHNKTIHLNVNPQKYANYQRALQYVDAIVAEKGRHFKESIGKTIETIQHIHKLLTDDLPHTEPINPGRFRTGWMILDGKGRPELLSEKAKKTFANEPENFNIFARSFNAVVHDVTYLGRLSSQEAALWDRLVYLPPAPNKIEPLMLRFALNLDTLLAAAGEIDYIDLAAYVHMQIAGTYAFTKGNGALARLLMNTFLRMGGHDPVVVYDDAEYIKIVDKAVRNPIEFTNYLRNYLIPWTQKHKNTLRL